MKTIQTVLVMCFVIFISTHKSFSQCLPTSGLSANGMSTTGTAALLSWTATAGSSGYSIEIQNGQNNPLPFLVTANTTSTNYTITGLVPSFIYKFKVRTICGGNKSNWSAWFQFAAGGGTINCTPISGLAVSNTTSSSATFNWTISPGGLGYALRVEDASGNPIDYAFNTATTATSYTLNGLNSASNYKVKIRKRCAPGVTGPWSSWVNFTTSVLRESTLSNNNQTTIFPNPASESITLSNNNSDERILACQIFDMTGKLVNKIGFSPEEGINDQVIDTSDLPNGIYTVKITSNISISTQRVVILNK